MPECKFCHKSILVWNEPKQKFTILGSDFFHSRCYMEIHKHKEIGDYANS